MKRVLHGVLLGSLVAIGFASPCQAIQFRHAVGLQEAKFGIVGENSNVRSSEVVPLVPDTVYGVDVTFKKQAPGIVLRVELELPAAPKTWGGWATEEGARISKDQKTCSYTTDACTDGSDTMISWAVAEGDPEGVYKVRLYLGNSKTPFRTFTFKVVRP